MTKGWGYRIHENVPVKVIAIVLFTMRGRMCVCVCVRWHKKMILIQTEQSGYEMRQIYSQVAWIFTTEKHWFLTKVYKTPSALTILLMFLYCTEMPKPQTNLISGFAVNVLCSLRSSDDHSALYQASSQLTLFCKGPDSAKQGLAPACKVPWHFWRITGARTPGLLTEALPLHSCATGDSEELSNPQPIMFCKS